MKKLGLYLPQLLCGHTVPEAIHNQVAIKLLKSGLLT